MTIHSEKEKSCAACWGCHDDQDFDVCRCCGYTKLPHNEAEQILEHEAMCKHPHTHKLLNDVLCGVIVGILYWLICEVLT